MSGGKAPVAMLAFGQALTQQPAARAAALRVGKRATAPLSPPESQRRPTQPPSAVMEGEHVGKLLEKRGSGVHPPPVLPVTLPRRLAPAGP